MKRKIFYALSFCFLVFVSCKNDQYERIIDDEFELTEYNRFEHLEGHIVRFWANDSLVYISNAPEFGIYVYDNDGNFLKKNGVKGPAPWEHGTLWHFSREDSIYWVHDYPKQLIKKYTYDDDSLTSHSKVITSNNVHYIGGDKFIVPRSEEAGKFLLSLFDARKKAYTKNINLLDYMPNLDKTTIEHVHFLLEGDMCSYKNQVYYYCYFSGISFLVDLETLKVRVLQDFRNFDMPRVEIKNQIIHLRPNIGVRRDACMDDEYIYVYTRNKPEKDGKFSDAFFIDFYNLETLKYEKSITIPKNGVFNQPYRIQKTFNGFVVAYKNGEVVYYKLIGN